MSTTPLLKTIHAILCVHQGYELYGSDRSFALSIATLHELYPNAWIDVMIPKNGSIRQILEPIGLHLIINQNLGVLRKKNLEKNPLKATYTIIKGVLSAVSRAKKYDLVYVNTVVVLDYILAARFMKCSTVLHVREIPTGFQRLLFSKIVSFSKMSLIFNSASTARAFSLPPGQHTFILLNGVRGFSNLSVRKMSGGGVHLLLLGRLSAWKGQMFFLQALHQLMKQKKYAINVRIVGDVFEDQIIYKNNLLAYAREHDLEKFVSFKSFNDNPEEEYEWCDIVVIPSIKPEPFGRVAIEAMSAGKCVIAANHGGLTEIIEHKENGLLFQPGDIDSLTTNLRELLENPILISRYGLRGLKTFKMKYSEKIYRDNFKGIIKEIMCDE